ncbi:hypothetical protein C9374_005525 [Naegleria lovaniensis]|uniref:Uncharacterized protein n=1 Tax=Naegleria lovaniensis TaxID=51637 RepID=A0AA88KJX3_NAELO|nr:uncharacterized protein C9374_005525 [Naegleria lovaniensis]KAG2382323.1 hypothetical protein C9374_005525 [Naegleria lovaniensis]
MYFNCVACKFQHTQQQISSKSALTLTHIVTHIHATMCEFVSLNHVSRFSNECMFWDKFLPNVAQYKAQLKNKYQLKENPYLNELLGKCSHEDQDVLNEVKKYITPELAYAFLGEKEFFSKFWIQSSDKIRQLVQKFVLRYISNNHIPNLTSLQYAEQFGLAKELINFCQLHGLACMKFPQLITCSESDLDFDKLKRVIAFFDIDNQFITQFHSLCFSLIYGRECSLNGSLKMWIRRCEMSHLEEMSLVRIYEEFGNDNPFFIPSQIVNDKKELVAKWVPVTLNKELRTKNLVKLSAGWRGN